MAGGARPSVAPSPCLVWFTWLWPWISFWALSSTPVDLSSCIKVRPSMVGTLKRDGRGILWQFLVSFQVRGAPREGQGWPRESGGGQTTSKSLQNHGKIDETLRKQYPEASWSEKFPDGPFYASLPGYETGQGWTAKAFSRP